MNLRAYSAAWLLKRKIISVPPLDAKSNIQEWKRVFRNNAFLNKFCWDILLDVHEKSENKVEKDKKNLSILNEILANNISQSTASIS